MQDPPSSSALRRRHSPRTRQKPALRVSQRRPPSVYHPVQARSATGSAATSGRSLAPGRAHQIFTMPSSPPEAMRRPSGLQASQLIPERWPIFASSPVADSRPARRRAKFRTPVADRRGPCDSMRLVGHRTFEDHLAGQSTPYHDAVAAVARGDPISLGAQSDLKRRLESAGVPREELFRTGDVPDPNPGVPCCAA